MPRCPRAGTTSARYHSCEAGILINFEHADRQTSKVLIPNVPPDRPPSKVYYMPLKKNCLKRVCLRYPGIYMCMEAAVDQHIIPSKRPYTAQSSMMRFSWPSQGLQGANSAGLPRSFSAFRLWVSPCLWWPMLPSQLTSICSRSFSCGTGLQALTACLRIPDWPRRLGSNFAHTTAGLGAPKMQLAHLIGSHQWEMPTCTRFSGSAWGLITSKLRRAASSTCLGPVVFCIFHPSFKTPRISLPWSK